MHFPNHTKPHFLLSFLQRPKFFLKDISNAVVLGITRGMLFGSQPLTLECWTTSLHQQAAPSCNSNLPKNTKYSLHAHEVYTLVNGPQHATKLLTRRVFVPLLSLLLCHNVVLTALSLWQGGVGVASESCLHHNQWQCSEPVKWRGRELDGEQRPGGVHQVSAACSHASLDKAQHPPLQGKTGLSHLEHHLLCYYCYERKRHGEVQLNIKPLTEHRNIWSYFVSVTGLSIRCVHPWAGAVRRQAVHVAAAASQWGLQLQLLASGGDQGARAHHAPADLWAG